MCEYSLLEKFGLINLSDNFLTVFHDLFTLWNLFGLFFPSFRIYHFITINLTLVSWTVLGYFYGLGYCILTDIHYGLKYCRGEFNLPSSYIQLRILELFGVLPDLEITNYVLGISFSFLLIASDFLF
ncbi:MAG: DUF2784 family protein [Leptospiraceae bacterium]|nr:DUF2784 family protein [Leptospiraceae bacterium]